MSIDPDNPEVEKRPAIALSPGVERALSFQEYGATPVIQDVRVRRLRKARGENGWFLELFRLDGGVIEDQEAPALDLRQVSASYAQPERINAFHIHPLQPQDELWTVLEGSLLIWLVDCRSGSPTEGVRQKVLLSGEDPGQLFIPAGVAHGYRAGASGALLLYAMNQQFQPDAPNEGRLPWDHFGAELWREDRG